MLVLLGRVLHVDPTAIHVMRGASLWELAYGPAFFFFGPGVLTRISELQSDVLCRLQTSLQLGRSQCLKAAGS